MTRAIVALTNQSTRIPEAGRVRLGIKSGKAMKSIDTFRFSAIKRGTIDELAKLYGGTVQPMSDPKSAHQWQVISEINELPIILGPDPITCSYEEWAGSGRTRSCDGVTVEVPVSTPDGWEPQEVPCICDARGALSCKPITRLNVIIPTISFAGVWRLDTKGWNALAEMPAMVRIVQQMTEAGTMVRATLTVERRQTMTVAGKRNFVVPGIALPYTADEMLQGGAKVVAIETGVTQVAIGAGGGRPPVPQLDPIMPPITDPMYDESGIVDGEVVDPLEERMFELGRQHRFDGARAWAAICAQVGYDGPDNVPAGDRIAVALAKIESGSLTVLGFNDDGSIKWGV